MAVALHVGKPRGLIQVVLAVPALNLTVLIACWMPGHSSIRGSDCTKGDWQVLAGEVGHSDRQQTARHGTTDGQM